MNLYEFGRTSRFIPQSGSKRQTCNIAKVCCGHACNCWNTLPRSRPSACFPLANHALVHAMRHKYAFRVDTPRKQQSSFRGSFMRQKTPRLSKTTSCASRPLLGALSTDLPRRPRSHTVGGKNPRPQGLWGICRTSHSNGTAVLPSDVAVTGVSLRE